METQNNISPTLIGNILLQRGFADWFLYLFRIINDTPFIVEPFHREMFRVANDVVEMKLPRVVINVFPRSAKTTLGIYMCVYALLTNPRSQIIYTSFNQQLLKQVATLIQQIMTHPAFLAMYPTLGPNIADVQDKPQDEWWRDYAMKTEGKPTFSASRITTPQGGLIYLASMGSALTGLGAGSRTSKEFSGMLFVDDPNQPSQARSATIRNKTQIYFTETLLSRLNSPQTPIVVCQQRVHLEDLTNYILSNYDYYNLVIPLVDENGVCASPSQYDEARIKELEVDTYTWNAQYLQSPIQVGGNLFKHEWWRYYADAHDTRYRRIFITADTASKTKEWNDYTAIGVWGLTAGNHLRLLDYVHGRFEIPELEKVFLTLWEKWKAGIAGCRCTAVYIEDKASGTQVIQQLRRVGGLPILPVTPKADKLTRALDGVPQVAAGNVYLPESDKNPMSAELLKDLDAFSADMSHKFDDGVDCTLYALDAAFNRKGYF